MLFRKLIQHVSDHAIRYLSAYVLILFIIGLWPFNFTEKNNAVISSTGGLEIARHGTAYTALPAGKLQDLKQFAILIDLTTTSDGLDSLGKIFGCLISQEAENFFLAQWKDGMELRVRTERNAGGMIFGTDGVLKKEERAACLIVYDGLKMHIYKNGKLIRRDNRGPLSFSNWSREYPLVLGTDANGRSQWKGVLYQIAMWDRSLTPAEVADYTRQAFEGGRGADSRQPTVDSKEVYSQQPAAYSRQEISLQPTADSRQPAATRQDNPPVSPFAKGGESDGRPLIHYVFKTENTYQTEIRGKKASGVRDLGKGEPADLVIPEHFAPYQRLYLGWDPDWIKRSTEWLDVAVNILGFVPFGVLLMLALSKAGTRDEGVGTSAAQRQERRSQQPTADSQQPTDQDRAASRSIAVVVVLAVVAGFVVSFAIEYVQAYLPSRDSSMRDLATNILGTLIGAAAAVWFSRKRIA